MIIGLELWFIAGLATIIIFNKNFTRQCKEAYLKLAENATPVPYFVAVLFFLIISATFWPAVWYGRLSERKGGK